MPPAFQNLDRLHYPPRPANAREELEKILRALVDGYGAEKIIAFGSAVRGGVTEHSDIDLCVVRDHPADCSHPALDADLAVSRIHPLISSDVLVRTPAQFEAACSRPFGVMEEIVRHGVLVYER
jgi:predicted nucleotidyltransferase